MRPVGLGLVGAGEVAARHVQAAESVPEVRIAATYDLRPEASTVPDYDALLAHPGVEVVVLTVPHALARQYRALVRTLREGAEPDIRPAEGLSAVAAVEAIYASAERLGVRMPIRT